MAQFEFYKKRDFGSYIGDSFGFLKHYFKNFNRIFFIINTPPLLLLSFVIGAFILNYNTLEQLSEASLVAVFVGVIIFLGCLFIVSVFPFTYGLYAEKHPHDNNFKPEEILKNLKNILGKSIVYFFAVFGVSILLSIIVSGILALNDAVLLLFSIILLYIIGVFILPTLIAQCFIIYASQNISLSKAFVQGWQTLWNNLIHKIAAAFVINIISTLMFYTVLGLVILGVVVLETSGVSVESFISESSLINSLITAMLVLVMTLIMIYVMSLQAFVQLMFYFSSKEEAHQFDIINQIGENSTKQ